MNTTPLASPFDRRRILAAISNLLKLMGKPSL